MSKKSSGFPIFGPLLSLAVVTAGLYVKMPQFRNFVDEKVPQIKEAVAKYAPSFGSKVAENPASAPETPGGESEQPPKPPAPGAPEARLPDAGPPSPETRPGAVPESAKPAFDLQKVCSDPALWPKTVSLKRNVYFPAVLNGKVVGTLRAPKGAEARLVTIQNGKLGLEYQGGGAWLDLGGTDFEGTRAAGVSLAAGGIGPGLQGVNSSRGMGRRPGSHAIRWLRS